MLKPLKRFPISIQANTVISLSAHTITILRFNATPDDILKSWDQGQIHIGSNVSNASIVYTLKYSMKSKLYKMYHKSVPYQRPFMLCSKGIGSDFLKHKHLPTILHWNNLKITLPRYYTKKLNITLDDPEMRQRMIDQSFKLLAELDRRKRMVLMQQLLKKFKICGSLKPSLQLHSVQQFTLH